MKKNKCWSLSRKRFVEEKLQRRETFSPFQSSRSTDRRERIFLSWAEKPRMKRARGDGDGRLASSSHDSLHVFDDPRSVHSPLFSRIFFSIA